MILLRILRRDLRRSGATMAVVLAFVMLSALLMASGASLLVMLTGAIEGLFDAARVPDVVQMHAGDIQADQISTWVASQPDVVEYQISEMISVDGGSLYLGGSQTAEEDSVMDISFVRQNDSFDLLLDGSNLPFSPDRGTVGVPLYFAERSGLALGDPVVIQAQDREMRFTVSAFVRDAQMNPSIVHSKRFVVHNSDYRALQEICPETEYLISFCLTDPDSTTRFISAYQDADLPQQGPIVDRNLFRTLNALSDGIVAVVVILVSLILMVIAILCLRFTILASIEEDYREIGVMKAVGMPIRHIRRIYVAKYLAVGAVAALVGYALSLPLTAVLARDIAAFLGSPPAGPLETAIPAVAAGLVFAIVVFSCLLILRRFRRISAVGALRSTGVKERIRTGRGSRLGRFRRIDVNVALGLRDATQRARLYGLLWCIFFFATFTIILPLHFLSTITSPSFISYMGIGRSDMRIDLRRTLDTEERFDALRTALATDPNVVRFAPLVTSQFTMIHSNGERETIAIETGDVSIFPLDYLHGGPPRETNEIALSYRNAEEMDLRVGDTLTLLIDGIETVMTVRGIYQDVTNGGRTAKARIPHTTEGALWYSFSVDFTSDTDLEAKTREYSTRFAPARVTDLAGYMEQTLGGTIAQLGVVTIVAALVGLGISALVTSLFLQMLMRKDAIRIAIMRSLGFTRLHIRRQYLTSVHIVLAAAVIGGTVFSNTAGQRLVSALWSYMGAAQIHFVIAPFKVYVMIPFLFSLVVTLTTRMSVSGIKASPGGIQ